MKRICGIDEAGRGPLAGPIVAAAVVIPENLEFSARDSKKMTPNARKKWVEEFKAFAAEHNIDYAYCVLEVPQINRGGIGWANRKIFRDLVEKMDADWYLVDGNLRLSELGNKQNITQSVIKGDQLHAVIAAASILAKTKRDEIMLDLHEQFPHYHWDRNKGYGTKQHISAIKTFGSTPHHREQFVSTVQEKDYGQPLLLLGAGTSGLPLITLLGQLIQHLL